MARSTRARTPCAGFACVGSDLCHKPPDSLSVGPHSAAHGGSAHKLQHCDVWGKFSGALEALGVCSADEVDTGTTPFQSLTGEPSGDDAGERGSPPQSVAFLRDALPVRLATASDAGAAGGAAGGRGLGTARDVAATDEAPAVSGGAARAVASPGAAAAAACGDVDGDAEGVAVAPEVVRVSLPEAEELLRCAYVPRMVFEGASLLRTYKLWMTLEEEASTLAAPRGYDSVEHAVLSGYVHPGVAVGRMAPVVSPGAAGEPGGPGWGLFATRRLRCDELLCVYAGCLREARHGAPHDAYGMHYPSPGGQAKRLSAAEFGNVARCINHGGAAANVQFRHVFARGVLQLVAVVAARGGVPAGAQLLTDYGDAYWKDAGLSPADFTGS